jgi:large repetitive protein
VSTPLPARVTRVRIGPNEARDVTVIDDTTLIATYMGGGDGPEDVTVTTDAGEATAAGAFYAVPPPRPPTINGVEPNSGRGGTIVTIHGSGFQQ